MASGSPSRCSTSLAGHRRISGAVSPGGELTPDRAPESRRVCGQRRRAVRHNGASSNRRAQARRINQFHRRGRSAARSGWRLITATHNLLRLHKRPEGAPGPDAHSSRCGAQSSRARSPSPASVAPEDLEMGDGLVEALHRDRGLREPDLLATAEVLHAQGNDDAARLAHAHSRAACCTAAPKRSSWSVTGSLPQPRCVPASPPARSSRPRPCRAGFPSRRQPPGMPRRMRP